jgi:hypothetical protein
MVSRCHPTYHSGELCLPKELTSYLHPYLHPSVMRDLHMASGTVMALEEVRDVVMDSMGAGTLSGRTPLDWGTN